MIRAKGLPASAALLALLASIALVAAAAEPPRRSVTLDDMNQIKWPNEPWPSPDGKQIAYEVDGRIYVVPTGGGEPRGVTSAGSTASNPVWSRDGAWLYFLSDRADKKSQVWKLPLTSFGEATQVTTFERGIDTLNLSPDESRLLLSFKGTVEQKSGGHDAAQTPAPPPKPAPWVITRLHFKEDAEDGYLTGDRAEHLYIYDLKTQALRQITSGDYTESEAAWSPDGRSVVFTSNREAEPDESYKTDLWIVAADNPDRGLTVRRLTNDDWVKSQPVFSPDGRNVAYITAEDGVYGIQHVAVIAASGGAPRILTRPLDRWVNQVRFSADGQWIYFSYEQLGGVDIGRVRVSDGKLETVLAGQRQIATFNVARTGVIAALVQNMNDPVEVYAFTRGQPRQLSDINGAFVRSVALGSKEKVEFASADGTKVEAFVTKPPGFEAGRKYPTVLSIHGGPVGQTSYGYDFSNQYLAAQGYVIVEPNPRGSTGRGQDFIRAIYRTWGITDYDDVIAAVDHVVKLGYADPDRLAVTGYSYGGYMTNVVITRTKRFKAAASGAGHSFIAANYGHDIYQKWYSWELGVPWENADKYARLSPLMQAGAVQTPTLFFGGREDWNVPVLNAELFYQSLKKRGVDTELVVYPGTHHGGWSDEFERDRLVRIEQWFDKYLQAAPAQAAP
ncbi:MAG TPA: S9 family peptidase [Steroidobacteraceae bacterium]|nr:S9 family peptidase [Steroidobacteraceae bacterium]